MTTTFGAWIDSPPVEVLKPSWWAQFRELGFSTGAIMVETFREGLDERWKDDQIAHAGVLARMADVELVLTFCPEPKVSYLNEFERRAPALCEMSGAAALDSDAEGNFLKSKLEGYPSLEAAATDYVSIIRKFSRTLDIRLELDTYPFHQENSANAKLAPLCDRIYAQAYSVRKREDGTGQEILVDWDDRFGPELMAKITLDRTLQIPGVKDRTGPQLCVGAAAYDQSGWPGKTAHEAMKTALDAMLIYKPIEVRYWSTRHIFGPRANSYAVPFFRSLLRPV